MQILMTGVLTSLLLMIFLVFLLNLERFLSLRESKLGTCSSHTPLLLPPGRSYEISDLLLDTPLPSCVYAYALDYSGTLSVHSAIPDGVEIWE